MNSPLKACHDSKPAENSINPHSWTNNMKLVDKVLSLQQTVFQFPQCKSKPPNNATIQEKLVHAVKDLMKRQIFNHPIILIIFYIFYWRAVV